MVLSVIVDGHSSDIVSLSVSSVMRSQSSGEVSQGGSGVHVVDDTVEVVASGVLGGGVDRDGVLGETDGGAPEGVTVVLIDGVD